MRLLRAMLGMVAVVAVMALMASAVDAQDKSSGFQLGKRRPALGASYVERMADARHVPEDWMDYPAFRAYGAYYPYYIAPWGWYAPQTVKHRRYPPPVALEPRLGLQYNYPYAWQAGIQLPAETEPLTPRYPSEFVGVVATAKRRMAGVAQAREDAKGIQLMKQGKFKAAGRRFAESFKHDSHPRYALVLAEVFVGMGKYAHAELLLREALKMEGGAEALPAKISDHFPTPEDFEKHTAAVDGTKFPLLKGYLLVHSKNPVAGLDALKDTVNKDKEAALVYRHYLARAFAEAEAK